MDLWINGGSGEGGREVVKTTSNKDEGDDNFALFNAPLCLMLRFALHFDSSLFTLHSSLFTLHLDSSLFVLHLISALLAQRMH